MNIVLLNPPNAKRIQRRYMCSYNAPSMLFPPHELVALGGILKGFEKCQVYLIDAIAEQLDTGSTVSKIKQLHADIVVAIHGFECFEEDIDVLDEIKTHMPLAKMILFGHYATVFPEEVLDKSKTDIIILGEPDTIFSQLIRCLLDGDPLSDIGGIAYRGQDGICIQKGDDRIIHPELLPMPAYELLDASKYFEPFLQAPLGLIQSARGCPYSCNYCVRSFGKRLTYRTPDQIIEEIVFLKEKQGIRSLRFIDDTFTVHGKRVIEICKRLIELKINLEWTCLSRVDTLTDEMIPWMKRAGCKRIYFGIESGSERVLKYLNKDVNLAKAISTMHNCKKHGIETLGFFIVGAPVESEEDFNASIDFAIEADFDYITVSELIPYPGTEFFETVKNDIDFSLLPYKNEWKSKALKERNRVREKEFYRRFYYRRKYFVKSARRVLKHPAESIANFKNLSSFLLAQRINSRFDYI